MVGQGAQAERQVAQGGVVRGGPGDGAGGPTGAITPKVLAPGVGDAGARRIGKWGSMAPDFDKALRGRPEGAPVVLLCHQPQGFGEALARKVDLTLSGHTHGGQVGFKALDWSLAKLFMKYHMGLFKEGESHLYVTPGTGYWALPVRFGMSPEISLIELVPA